MTVSEMLRSRVTYDWAVRYLHEGRISQRVFDHWCLFYDWAAPRFTGAAGIRQDRFYTRMGADAYWRRIDRVKRLHNRVVGRAS